MSGDLGKRVHHQAPLHAYYICFYLIDLLDCGAVLFVASCAFFVVLCCTVSFFVNLFVCFVYMYFCLFASMFIICVFKRLLVCLVLTAQLFN